MSSGPNKDSGRERTGLGALSALFARLQNIFAITVWPDNSDNSLAIADDDADLLLFGNAARAATPINSPSGVISSSSSSSGEIRPLEPRFLDDYSESDIRGFFSEFKIKDGPNKGKNFETLFAELGFKDLKFSIDVSDEFVHRIHLYNGKKTGENLLAQLFIRRETAFSILDTKTFDAVKCGVPDFYAEGFKVGLSYLRKYFAPSAPSSGLSLSGQKKNQHIVQMIAIEWLRFQDPSKVSKSKPLLPGQNHPGLGIVNDMQLLLEYLCSRKGRDGVMNIPEHWYNAYLYSRLRWPYRFLNPVFQGFFESTAIALESDIKKRGLPDVAWAVHFGKLRCRVPVVPKDGSGDKTDISDLPPVSIRWVAQEQVAAVTPKLKDYFSSKEYTDLVSQYRHPELFYIDWESPQSSDEIFGSSPQLDHPPGHSEDGVIRPEPVTQKDE